MDDRISAAIAEEARRRTEAVEAACVESMIHGLWGVEIRSGRDGTWSVGLSCDVPAGQIYHRDVDSA